MRITNNSPITGAIETMFHGYRMRSRLEARWGVYFDACGIEWEYEKEGYDLSRSPIPESSQLGFYLPDFWLPQVKMWAEVKPDQFDQIEVIKCDALAKLTGYPCLMLDGLPQPKPYWARDQVNDFGGESDYIIDSSYLEEHRFYGNTCLAAGEPIPKNQEILRACDAARSARFEFGDLPERRIR